jgi:tRNAThr (cytosine32-N3)-methyltransferase
VSAEKFTNHPDRFWNRFYTNNNANFFKDRKWLHQEFPILTQLSQPDAGQATIVEVGAGAGNTAFPIMALNKNPLLTLHACDFSRAAVKVMRASPLYNPSSQIGTLSASVWDAASEPSDTAAYSGLPEGVTPESVDLVLLIFIFSALSPSQWRQTMSNVFRMLKPGGSVLFRDYGRGDLAQVRFKAGRYMADNFYARGDGTRVYFFAEEELRALWTGKMEGEAGAGVEAGVKDSEAPKFEVVNFGVDRRMLVNRQRRLKMYRCWMQARFRKPDPSQNSPIKVSSLE